MQTKSILDEYRKPNSKYKNRSLSDCNGTRTHNHLVSKRELNHLANIKL